MPQYEQIRQIIITMKKHIGEPGEEGGERKEILKKELSCNVYM